METETNTKTIQEFITENQLEMSTVKVTHNPSMDAGDKWQANHYEVTIKQVGMGASKQMTLYYSMGIGLKRKPTLGDVLDSLASDAMGYDNARDFESWALDYGYDTDSRKAEKIYHTIAEHAKQLRHLLGHKAYTELLEQIERL